MSDAVRAFLRELHPCPACNGRGVAMNVEPVDPPASRRGEAMTNLSEFLLARIAEDEATAQQWPDDRPPPPNGAALWMDALGHPIYQPRARVLAECEAKRGLLQLAQHIADNAWQDGGLMAVSEYRADQILRLLALPYASHLDFREEWRP